MNEMIVATTKILQRALEQAKQNEILVMLLSLGKNYHQHLDAKCEEMMALRMIVSTNKLLRLVWVKMSGHRWSLLL